MGSKMIAQSHKRLKNWHTAIDTIKVLHLLALDIRAHRGASTACLEGDVMFISICEKYARQINVQFQMLQLLLSGSEYFDEEEVKVLKSDWIKIQANAKDYPVLSNFYNHCDLLNQIQALIWQFALQADNSLSSNSDKALVSRYVLKHHAHAMEAIARLRGFTCAFCARPEVSQKERRLLSDEIQSVFNTWQRRKDACETLPFEYYKRFQKNASLSDTTEHLLSFVDSVSPLQHEHAAEQAKNVNASEVFNQANAILNTLNEQYLEGLDVLKSFLPDDLATWVNGKVDCDEVRPFN